MNTTRADNGQPAIRLPVQITDDFGGSRPQWSSTQAARAQCGHILRVSVQPGAADGSVGGYQAAQLGFTSYFEDIVELRVGEVGRYLQQ